VPVTSAVHAVADLAGRRVSLGAEAAGTHVLGERVLLAAGVDRSEFIPSFLDTAASAQALQAGTVDAVFVTGGLPTPAVAALAGPGRIRLIPFAGDVTQFRDESGAYYHHRFIPAGTYGLSAEVDTVGVANVLVVNRTMPDDVAEILTDVLFEAKPRLVEGLGEIRNLDLRSAIAVAPLVLHPGAVRYYRRAKPLAGP